MLWMTCEETEEQDDMSEGGVGAREGQRGQTVLTRER
jgi:hypothetical protein